MLEPLKTILAKHNHDPQCPGDLITGGCMEAIEGLIVRCRSDLGLTAEGLDWHYVGGRAIVRMMPGDKNTEKVITYLNDHLPMRGGAL